MSQALFTCLSLFIRKRQRAASDQQILALKCVVGMGPSIELRLSTHWPSESLETKPFGKTRILRPKCDPSLDNKSWVTAVSTEQMAFLCSEWVGEPSALLLLQVLGLTEAPIKHSPHCSCKKTKTTANRVEVELECEKKLSSVQNRSLDSTCLSPKLLWRYAKLASTGHFWYNALSRPHQRRINRKPYATCVSFHDDFCGGCSKPRRICHEDYAR